MVRWTPWIILVRPIYKVFRGAAKRFTFIKFRHDNNLYVPGNEHRNYQGQAWGGLSAALHRLSGTDFSATSNHDMRSVFSGPEGFTTCLTNRL
jgi:hypothetical protein